MTLTNDKLIVYSRLTFFIKRVIFQRGEIGKFRAALSNRIVRM